MEALERKIRGVYDALEARNDKVSGCRSTPVTWYMHSPSENTDNLCCRRLSRQRAQRYRNTKATRCCAP